MGTATNKQHNIFVAYFRVSTAKQGESGLGLEAQRFAVRDFIARHGGEMAREFVEIESGRKSNRPELGHALAYGRKHKATL
ncbi:recombinase family protein [Mesorhizobium sp. M1312]|uniref:recombinase family protein n=1 Tax=unclassified Mesorhizobium TaxID=325217 RepID=UPI003336AED9